MGKRTGLVLVLLAATAAAGRADEEVRRLGGADPIRRRIAASRLLGMGQRAWPALERGMRSADPEVAGNARRILRVWAWTPPHLRDVLNADRRRALFGIDDGARVRTALELRDKLGDAGREALEYVMAAPPATFRVEEASPRRTHLELAPEVAVRLRNVSPHPGWAPPRPGTLAYVEWRPFGRPVSFPARTEQRGVRGRFRTRYCVVVGHSSFVAETQWVMPRDTARATRSLLLEAPRPGVATFAVAELAEAYPGGQMIARVENDRILSIQNELPFAVPVDLATSALTHYMLPRPSEWGAPIDGARVEAQRQGAELVVRLSSDFPADAPRDFGSVWYVALDAQNELVAHGPLDGGGEEAREYAAEDLAPVPSPPDALTRAFPMPDLEPGATRLLVGAAFSRGREESGYTAVSRALALR